MSRGWIAAILAALSAVVILSTIGGGADTESLHGSLLKLEPSDPLNDPGSPWQIVYGGDMRSDPLPSPAPRTRVTAADAVAAINRYPNSPMDQAPPRATLRMVTIGSVRLPPASAPRPMWVLTWTWVDPHHVGGPANLSPHDRQVLNEAVARVRCVRVEAVDAQTERIYGIYEICSWGLASMPA
jgi:hypothetical protein